MSAITRSWNIFKKSLALISANRKLLLFPAVSFFFIMVLILGIIGGIVMAAVFFPEAAPQEKPDLTTQLIILAVYFIVYLLTMTVSTFCLTAFYNGIYCGMNGEEVSLSRSFSFALSRWKPIVLWSLLASTIGILLKMLENRSSVLGKFVIRIIGMLWAVASCFAIPVLVMKPELGNPFTILKHSVDVIRKTWGESLIGFAGIRILTFLAATIWIAGTAFLLALCFKAGSTLCWIAGGTLMLFLFAAFSIFSYLINAANHVYSAALFRYAEYGDPGLFSKEELEAAFKHRKG